MSTDEYVPSEDDVRSVWVVHERDCGWAPHPGDPSAEFDRFLARVRRTAAREAVLRLRDHLAESRGYGLIGPEGLDHYIRREHPEEAA